MKESQASQDKGLKESGKATRSTIPFLSTSHPSYQVKGAPLAGQILIAIDKREQMVYKFNGYQLTFKTLEVGDYSISGFENRVVVERKTLGDFLGCLGTSRKRFWEELDKMEKWERKLLVVECNLEDLLIYDPTFEKKTGRKRRITRNVVLGSVVSILSRGIPVVFTSTRAEGEEITLRFLVRAWEELKGLRR
jgi:ERCC4-type nuclease